MKAVELITQTHSLLADRVRLAIMATLAAANAPMEFASLRDTLELSKGNLSSHTQKLEQAGLIQVKKEFVGRKPKTTYLCTELGRNEIQNYLSKIETLLKQTKKGNSNE